MTWGMSAAQMDDAALTAGAHRGNPANERARAVRAVAAMSDNAAECVEILDMLGLDPSTDLKGERA